MNIDCEIAGMWLKTSASLKWTKLSYFNNFSTFAQNGTFVHNFVEKLFSAWKERRCDWANNFEHFQKSTRVYFYSILDGSLAAQSTLNIAQICCLSTDLDTQICGMVEQISNIAVFTCIIQLLHAGAVTLVSRLWHTYVHWHIVAHFQCGMVCTHFVSVL